jgi:16S rRNA (uracil1498-N3)-methyltransferase
VWPPRRDRNRFAPEFSGIAYDRTLVPWELAAAGPLRDTLPALLTGVRTVLVTIGPEGGLSGAEAESAARAGAHLISLGSRILRTETAGLVACAAVFYASGDM